MEDAYEAVERAPAQARHGVLCQVTEMDSRVPRIITGVERFGFSAHVL